MKKALKLGFRPKHGDCSGGKKTPEYNAWRNMRRRCCQESNKRYKYYGGRGIKVCERWGKYENFLLDMGRRPTKKHTLDRIDVNGNYEPSNCRWETHKEQCRNRTNNRLIKFDGEIITIAEAAEKTGIPRHTLAARMDKLGWSEEEALTRPHRYSK